MIHLELKHYQRASEIRGFSFLNTPELYLLYKGNVTDLQAYLNLKYKNDDDKELLIQKWFERYELLNLIKITGSPAIKNYGIRFELKEVFKDQAENPVEWIDDWRHIFPTGSDAFGRYRGDKKGCLEKMKTFIRENPKVSKEEIFEATKRYVARHKLKRYEGMKRAHYFIKKDRLSMLAGEVEALGEKEITKPTSINKMI